KGEWPNRLSNFRAFAAVAATAATSVYAESRACATIPCGARIQFLVPANSKALRGRTALRRRSVTKQKVIPTKGVYMTYDPYQIHSALGAYPGLATPLSSPYLSLNPVTAFNPLATANPFMGGSIPQLASGADPGGASC